MGEEPEGEQMSSHTRLARVWGTQVCVRFVLQSRVHRLTLERQHAEDALVHTPERLALDEALEGFEAQGKLA